VKPFGSDKDAIQHFVLIVKLQLFIKSRIKHFMNGLQDIFHELVIIKKKRFSMTMDGLKALRKIKRVNC